MLKTLGVLVLIAALVGAWGWYRGWFTVERTGTSDAPKITFGLDKNRVKSDADAQKQKFDEAIQALQRKIDELKSKAKTASASEKERLDQAAADLETQRDVLRAKIDRLDAESKEKVADLRREIQQELDEARADADRALVNDRR